MTTSASHSQNVMGSGHKPLSANTLFHFTSTRENLLNILRNNFVPHYSLEDLTLTTRVPPTQITSAFPMVCFCDIPLSQIANHVDHYGRYAIGLTKDWGQSSGVSPVHYYRPNSLAAGAVNGMYGTLKQYLSPSDSFTSELAQDLIYITFFMKAYEGSLARPWATFENVRFYDEREWRYVPPFDRFHSSVAPFQLDDEQFRNPEFLRRAHDYLALHAPLRFEPKYIRYLIVAREDEILQFMTEVLEVKNRFLDDEKRLLTTRIVSMEQVFQDY